MKIPSRGKIYSINEGYTQYWDESVKQYIHKCKYPDVSGHTNHPSVICFLFAGREVRVECSLCWFHGG